MTIKKRRILIIHESGTFQTIIKRALFAEVPDVDLHIASSAPEAVDLLDRESFDMVISANEMEYMNGDGVFEIMKESGRHNKTGFLLLTSKLDLQNRKLFKSKGISNVLSLPFKAGELAREVEKLSQPREWRIHKRLEVPGTQVVIDPDGDAIHGEVVNLSLGGMLCDLRVREGVPEFSRYYQVDFQFSEQFNSATVTGKAYVLREAALHWLEPPEPEILQIAWRMDPSTNEDLQVLTEILKQVSED